MVCFKFSALYLALALQFVLVQSFTEYLLKTCAQSGFCSRNRLYSDAIQKSKKSYYSVDTSSVSYGVDPSTNQHVLSASVIKTIERSDIGDIKITLPFTLSFFEGIESIRFTIDEKREKLQHLPDYVTPNRYNETWMWASDKENIPNTLPLTYKNSKWGGENVITVTNKENSLKVELHTTTFKLKIYHKGTLALTINDRNLFNLEHSRTKENNFQNVLPEESTYNMFADDFEYSRDDTLIFGPESVALDFTFNNYKNLYGIPEHADSLRLTDTTDTEPYRLYNVDVFEYTINSKMPMYGAIPLMIAANPTSSVGVFWVNAADTWIDVKYQDAASQAHWMSESGTIDVVLFFGNKPEDISASYVRITGKPQLPLLSAIGYHQCRWNYNDEADVLKVDSEMDRWHFPYDYIWLDLEYTDDRKYFTWKPDSFPNPKRLLQKLARFGRNLVVLIDPHLKKDYKISDTVVQQNVAVNNSNNKPYIGNCWPGKSLWIDTFSPLAQKVWHGFYTAFSTTYKNLHIWNDMNEPSIFSGPETTAPKDLLHYGGFEERSVHNVYGLTVHESTFNSMKKLKADGNERPFILSRAFFSGSQRTAATWTGDNAANWDYLKISVPMCLTNNIVGMPFIGADIAGFSGDPDSELLIRWYQAGLWYPFFRGHAHIDSKRREPFLLEEPTRSIVRDAIHLRYSLLPSFYTAFYEAHINGAPIMKPMLFEKPEYEELYNTDDQFYIGNTGLMVKPVLTQGTTSVTMKFAPGIYYDYKTLAPTIIKGKSIQEKEVDASLDKIPLFVEGGHVLFRKDQSRRSTKLMKNDPTSILIAPDIKGNAKGKIYIDDGETFNYENGTYLEAEVLFEKNSVITIKPMHIPKSKETLGNLKILQITIAGHFENLGSNSQVTIKSEYGEHVSNIEPSTNGDCITIVDPLIDFTNNWTIQL